MTRPDTDIVEIFSDGACSGNPGPGGWGTLLRFGAREKELSGYEPETTNNRMELLGAIAGFEVLTRPCQVALTTDSQYVKKGMTEWIDGWVKRGWKNSQKKPVANRDLWERLLELTEPHQVEWHWVRGHDGHAENERCDALAREAIETGARAAIEAGLADFES
jgi:ribonuclease HI